MSKSSPETVINPLEVIPEYGTDSLRLALIQGMSAGNDQRLGRSKIITNRNFCNKLWNIARFIDGLDDVELSDPAPKSLADHWIIERLSATQDNIKSDLASFSFSEAYERLYHFIWNDLADWYIEASKDQQNIPLLNYVLQKTLIIAHPFAPFVSETIWQTMNDNDDSLLASMELEDIIDYDKTKVADFNTLKKLISEIRNVLASLKATDVTLYYSSEPLIKHSSSLIKKLTSLKAVEESAKQGSVTLTDINLNCSLDIDPSFTKKYLSELSDKKTKQDTVIKALEKRLTNKNYVSNAPASIVDQTKAQLKEAKQILENIELEQKRFKSSGL